MLKEKLGQIFTPANVAEIILDDAGYVEGNIIGKKIIEPSFGEGAILNIILRRLVDECRKHGYTNEEIKQEIESNIFGIEYDKALFDKTLKNLNATMSSLYGIDNICWNLFRMDALDWEEFDRFDYVVGNPPYVRLHDLSGAMRRKAKRFDFSDGTFDLYIIFFELGLKMLNNTGVLSFITPNAFIKNSSQGKFRRFLLENNYLAKMENYGSTRVFHAGTYTAITVLNKSKTSDKFVYILRDNEKRHYCTTYMASDFLTEEYGYGELPWILGSEEEKNYLSAADENSIAIRDLGVAQNGFATLRDSVFITEEIEAVKGNRKLVMFNGFPVEKDIVKRIVKGSRYHGGDKTSWVLFPYQRTEEGGFASLSEFSMQEFYPNAYKYFEAHREELEKRTSDKNAHFYQFGRSQGLTNCGKYKLLVNTMLSPHSNRVEVHELDDNTYVYSGIFVTANSEENLAIIKKALMSEDFYRYAFLHGKDKANGYKQINTKIIMNYHIRGDDGGDGGEKPDTHENMEDDITSRFTTVLNESNREMILSPRSNKRVEKIHAFMAKELLNVLGGEFRACSLGIGDGREYTVSGVCYDKKVDVAVFCEERNVGTLMVKFIGSNYKKNANNYFESMSGETMCVKSHGSPCFQLVILPKTSVCFTKEGEYKSLEHLTDKDIDKYRILTENNCNADTAPDAIAVVVIDPGYSEYVSDRIGEKADREELADNSYLTICDDSDLEMLSSENRAFLNTHGIDSLIPEMKRKIYAHTYGLEESDFEQDSASLLMTGDESYGPDEQKNEKCSKINILDVFKQAAGKLIPVAVFFEQNFFSIFKHIEEKECERRRYGEKSKEKKDKHAKTYYYINSASGFCVCGISPVSDIERLQADG